MKYNTAKEGRTGFVSHVIRAEQLPPHPSKVEEREKQREQKQQENATLSDDGRQLSQSLLEIVFSLQHGLNT